MRISLFHKVMLSISAIVLLPACTVPVFAQSNSFIQYAQEKLMLKDRKGDRLLLQLFWDTCETGLKKCVLRKNIAPQETQLRLPRFLQENPILQNTLVRMVDNSRVRPLFDAQATVSNLKKIIRDERARGLHVSFGRIHTWSAGRTSGLSKIIMALATASSSRFLYVGHEEELIEWIKTRPDNSVSIEALFHKSYILNGGNVYLTLLTIENVLSDATFEKDRENTVVNRKLADLYAGSPNKFGDWYHMFGTMLAGYVGEPARLIAKLYGIYRRISRGASAEKATIAADKAGADMGVELRGFVFEQDTKIKAKIATQIQQRETLVRASKGNIKYFGADGQMYIGPRF